MNTPLNNPAINPDDPKWTAYVLGEATEAERLEIEQLLETSEEARALIEELTLATETLRDELTPATGLMMSVEQRAAIMSAAEPKPRRWFEMFPSKWGLGLAAAAVLVLVAVLPLAWRNGENTPADASTVAGPVAVNEGKEPVEVTTEKLAQTVTAPAAESVRSTPPAAVAAPVVTPEQFAEVAQGNSTTALVAGNGSLSGVVRDSSSALIPGVAITAANNTTGLTRATVTNESGAFTFTGLPAGIYQVAASLPGFATLRVNDVQLAANDQKRLEMPLQVAYSAQKVEVTADTNFGRGATSATVGEVLPESRSRELPLVANDVQALINTAPGVRAAGPPPVVNTVVDGLSVPDGRLTQQGQQGGQGQGQGQGQQAPGAQNNVDRNAQLIARGGRGGGGGGGGAAAGGGGGRAGGARGAAAAAPPPSPPPPMTSTFSREPEALAKARAAAAPAAAPVAGRELDRANANVVTNPNTEAYDRIIDNPFIRTTQEPLATFSIDVDTASYANVRRFLNQNQLPPRDAVRIEELVNYFSYDYVQPSGNVPIAPNMEVAAAPWNPANRLVRIGIKAREVNANRRPNSNLVFLIDVSGSMNSPEKLPLVKAGLNMLTEQLGENDMVSMVVYAGSSGLVLPPTSGMRKEAIRQAIDRLEAGGSTNGGAGIQLAYNQATVNFLRNGSNRVVLMTDGDFNVGVTNQGDLTRLIQERAKSGVFLSVLGFGMGNIKDSTLEKLADQGNGNYAYIDNLAEARKVLVEEMSGTLITVAKDVKIQVDFNPGKVEAYRLIGYENRVLRTEDFNNDAKDAGDMGAGHTVTALFEVVPKGGVIPGPSIDPSKYTQPVAAAAANRADAASSSNEMLNLRVRYKEPDSDTSKRMDVPLVDRGTAFNRATADFRFAASVAQFGMILRDSPYRGTSNMESVLDVAQGSRGADRNGYRAEFITLVQKARNLGR